MNTPLNVSAVDLWFFDFCVNASLGDPMSFLTQCYKSIYFFTLRFAFVITANKCVEAAHPPTVVVRADRQSRFA